MKIVRQLTSATEDATTALLVSVTPKVKQKNYKCIGLVCLFFWPLTRELATRYHDVIAPQCIGTEELKFLSSSSMVYDEVTSSVPFRSFSKFQPLLLSFGEFYYF